MKIKNEKMLSYLTWGCMGLDYIFPLLVVKDITRIQNSKIIYGLLAWVILTVVIPISLPNIITRVFIIKDDKNDNETTYNAKNIIALTYLLTVFICSLFFYILYSLPRQY